MKSTNKAAVIAWLIAAVFYFYQYMLRSAPAVMLPQLSEAFGLSAMGVASLSALFYYGYSPFSLVAGVALDRLGPRQVVPIGALAVGVGALLFATGSTTVASVGRLLQGAGGVFSLVGAVYIATQHFPAARAATLIGATQMFGMAGGAAGQFMVAPVIAAGVSWSRFWIVMGCVGLGVAVMLFVLIPRRESVPGNEDWFRAAAGSLGTVFRNPQSILCGMISGLMFIPTTIFGMVWGVRYMQEARGFEYASAVLRSSLIPLGWIIGCPLLGFISDRLGRRKPVIIASALALLGCMAYTVIKEANPPAMGGTATGVINFLNFTLSALLGPAFGWILQQIAGGASPIVLGHYQAAFAPLLYGVGLAVLLALLLRETGPAVRASTLATSAAIP